MAFKTEYEFSLPRGYLSQDGSLIRDGVMRLSVALDEIEAVSEPRVQNNEAYLPVALLSKVIVRLGPFQPVPLQVIEGLFSSDLAYLEDLYLRINNSSTMVVGAVCPKCGNRFHLQVAPLNGASE